MYIYTYLFIFFIYIYEKLNRSIHCIWSHLLDFQNKYLFLSHFQMLYVTF